MASLETTIRRVLDLLAPAIEIQRKSSSHPLLLGITGLQGSGKSTWASKIVELLPSVLGLSAITVSLDDFYKTHDDLIAQRNKDIENKLYRTRGQPGTHDEQLARDFFAALNNWNNHKAEEGLKIPSFDKSRFNGEGDRAPKVDWPSVKDKVDVVVFEGWCVGFQAIPESEVEVKYREAKESNQPNVAESTNTLPDHDLAHLKELNLNLKRYNETFMGPQHFDFLIHIDTDDLRNVYRWRLQQEHAMIKVKGTGMKDEQVVAFVRGYMPGYELYLDGLREGFFRPKSERQVRVVLDQERNAEKIVVI